MNKIIKVCKGCGSQDVVKDAWIRWNISTQEFEISELFNNDYCISCEGETIIIDKEI